MTTIGLVIPSIPRRADMAAAAVASALGQSRRLDVVHVEVDARRSGAPATRNRGWRALDTEWVGFLDDDDVLYPHHVLHLYQHALETGADLVYPWFDVRDRQPDRPPFDFLLIEGKTAEGHPFDDAARATLADKANFIPITVLVKRALLEEVGGFPLPNTEAWPHDANEDWGCWRAMLAAGATFSHLPERTWQWRWHFDHTMGRP